MDLSNNIRKLRTAMKINQVEFAQKIGVTKQCVSNWENDNILPSVEMLVSIADFFSVPTDVLLGRSSDDVISVEGLSDEEISHLRAIVKDLQKSKK